MCYNYYKIMKLGDTMLTSDEVLNLNYYKKTSYTGWINGMRFLIRREAPEEGDAFFSCMGLARSSYLFPDG